MKSGPIALAALSLLLSSPSWAEQQNAAPGNQVTGRVVMEDGSPVPASVSVELKCHGQIRRRVRPYTNGDFTLVLGSDSSETPDIAVPGDLFGSKVPFDPRSGTGSVAAGGGGDVGKFDA